MANTEPPSGGNPGAARPPTATVFRGALALLSTQPLTWAVSLLSIIVVPKYVGAHGFGELSILFTLALLVGSAVSLGIPMYLVRRIATVPARTSAEPGAALVLACGAALLVATILSLGLPALGIFTSDPVLLELMLAAMVLTVGQQIIYSTLNGQGRHARFAWLNVLGVAANTGSGLIALVLGGDLRAYLAVTLVGSGSITAIAWKVSGLRVGRASFNSRLWLEMARGGWPFLGGNLAIQVRAQVVFIVTGLLLPAQAVGWLAAAYRVISIPVFIPTAVITPLLPVLSRHVDRPAEFQMTLRRSLITVLLLTVPASAMIFVVAPVLPDLFRWGSSFYASVPLIRLLSFQQPLVAADMVFGVALIALGRERQLLRVSIAGAVFNPVMNFVLVPIFESQFGAGVYAAAGVELATECLFLMWSIFLLPHGLLDGHTLGAVIRVLVAGAGLIVGASALSSLPLPVVVVGAGLVYLVLVLALGVVRVSDLLSIRRLTAFAGNAS